MKTSTKWLAVLGGFAIGASALAQAQTSDAILNALVSKGVLSTEEARQIEADAKKSAPVVATPGSRNVTRLAITGRVQAQFESFSTDVDGAADPAGNTGFNLRRVRLGATASFGPDFRGLISYDLVSNNLDAATIRWNQSSDLSVDFGFRKVNFGYEEYTSSARLKAIERSAVTRFFTEGNNNRRLGAGSRRVGVFADGKSGDFFYGAAITNVNRQDNPGRQAGNDLALWANAGFTGKSDSLSYTFGGAVGYLPEQRTNAGALNSPDSITVFSLFGDVTAGALTTVAELLYADNNAGAGTNSWGFYIQPSFAVSKQFELVGRWSYLDTDGRGVQVSDVIPGAPNAAGNTFDKVNELYAGMNYYFKGNDVKFSAGVAYADFDRTLAGAASGATVVGLRTQMQVNF